LTLEKVAAFRTSTGQLVADIDEATRIEAEALLLPMMKTMFGFNDVVDPKTYTPEACAAYMAANRKAFIEALDVKAP
jgi:hypothetical protein